MYIMERLHDFLLLDFLILLQPCPTFLGTNFVPVLSINQKGFCKLDNTRINITFVKYSANI